MAEVLIAAVFASIVGPIVAFIIKVLDQRLSRPPAEGAPTPVVGTPVTAPDWSERAYQSVRRELNDEQREHEVCHTIMREHGIQPPADHASN